jgi:hypothetical protein
MRAHGRRCNFLCCFHLVPPKRTIPSLKNGRCQKRESVVAANLAGNYHDKNQAARSIWACLGCRAGATNATSNTLPRVLDHPDVGRAGAVPGRHRARVGSSGNRGVAAARACRPAIRQPIAQKHLGASAPGSCLTPMPRSPHGAVAGRRPSTGGDQ